ncbi:MAG: hypothetical protein J4G17_02450 [Anaerolineae bacterium]|nr:hypothetical protein [Anaerolineae bacterium]
MTWPHPVLPFLSLSLALCTLFVWVVRFKSGPLIPGPGKNLPTLFVAVHALLLVIYLVADLTNSAILPLKLWHFDHEWTITSVNSTFQMLFLGILGFYNGIASLRGRFAERTFWLVLGSGFTGLSLFELIALNRNFIPEKWLLLLFGVFLVVHSLVLIRHYRKHVVRRVCLFLLPVGICLAAIAHLLDDATLFGITLVEPLEETLEVLGIAVALAGTAGSAKANVPGPRIGERKFLASICLTYALVCILQLAAPVWQDKVFQRYYFLWKGYDNEISADILDGALALRGWSHATLNPGEKETIRIWLYATRPLTDYFGITFQLLDQENGNPIASANSRSGIDTRSWMPGNLNSAFPKARLDIPQAAPTDRALWLTLSFWRIDEDEFIPVTIDTSDHPLLGDTHILLDELVFPDLAANSDRKAVVGDFANGFVLQKVDIPGRVKAGQSMDVEFLWNSVSDGVEDWTQFLHFIHETNGSHWNVDQYPLGQRLPTRLWYAGMQSREQWNVTVPPDLIAGTYKVYTGLYRLVDGQRLEVTLADGQRPEDRRIPLGSISIEN